MGIEIQDVKKGVDGTADSLQDDRNSRLLLDFISLAFRGTQIGFEKIMGMTDDIAAELKV